MCVSLCVGRKRGGERCFETSPPNLMVKNKTHSLVLLLIKNLETDRLINSQNEMWKILI